MANFYDELWSNTTLNSYESLAIFVSPLNFEHRTLKQVLRSAHCHKRWKAITEMLHDAEVIELREKVFPLPANQLSQCKTCPLPPARPYGAGAASQNNQQSSSLEGGIDAWLADNFPSTTESLVKKAAIP